LVGLVLRLVVLDPKGQVRAGPGEVTFEVQADTLLYQIVGRHSEPHEAGPPERPVLEVAMDYDRTRRPTKDALRARAAVQSPARSRRTW
jgi:hypothetical protein